MQRVDTTDVKKLLRNTTLLRSFSDEDLEGLSRAAVHRTLDAREVVFSQGDSCRSIYWIASGRVRITSLSRGGEELLLGMAEEGETFGELALLEGHRRIVSASAERSSHLISIDGSHLRPYVDRNAGAALAFSRLLAYHLGVAVSDLASLGLLEARERLYVKILSLGRRYGRPDGETHGVHIAHGLSQEDLARSIGLSRVMVNRIFTDWRTRGLIDFGRGFLVIRSEDDLEAYVQEGVSASESDPG
jgi:CRP/FNR family cyclic AMP-dependent transcriptional regulator